MRIIAVAHIDIDGAGVPTLLDGSWGVVGVGAVAGPPAGIGVQFQEINGPATPVQEMHAEASIMKAGVTRAAIVKPSASGVVVLYGQDPSGGGSVGDGGYAPVITGVPVDWTADPVGAWRYVVGPGGVVMVTGRLLVVCSTAGPSASPNLAVSLPLAPSPTPFAADGDAGGPMSALSAVVTSAGIFSLANAVRPIVGTQTVAVDLSAFGNHPGGGDSIDVAVQFEYLATPAAVAGLTGIVGKYDIPVSSRATVVISRRTSTGPTTLRA